MESSRVNFPKTSITKEILRLPSLDKDIQQIEFREDPLTGRPCRINGKRAERIKHAPSSVVPSEITGNREGCPFCPENIDRITTGFEQGFYPERRIRVGECYLFPNMFPLARHHVAATICRSHFLDLDEFKLQMVIDFMMASRQFLTLVHRHDAEAGYPILLWNHLPPSAASMVHPHIQILADARPTPYQRNLLDASREYLGKTGRSFWSDMVREERQRGERYIAENESVAVIASFAPQGNREAQIIFKSVSNLEDLKEVDIEGFADCIIKLLKSYKEMGVNSFNLSTFSAPLGEGLEYYSLHAKLISRPVLQPFYRNDTGILERFHHEADIEVMPEAFAENARKFFWSQ